jgi:hypothetical protein
MRPFMNGKEVKNPLKTRQSKYCSLTEKNQNYIHEEI